MDMGIINLYECAVGIINVLLKAGEIALTLTLNEGRIMLQFKENYYAHTLLNLQDLDTSKASTSNLDRSTLVKTIQNILKNMSDQVNIEDDPQLKRWYNLVLSNLEHSLSE